MNLARISSLTALLLTSIIGGSAHAGHEDAFRLGVKGAFGFGGEGSSQIDYYGELDDDLETSAGFTLSGIYPLHRFFHVGLQTTFAWGSSESQDNYDADSTFVWDISPVLKARLPLLNDALEVYVLVPIGLSIVVPPDQGNYYLGQLDTGIGWNAAVMAGVSYFVYDGLGIAFEIGWQGRGASNDSQSNVEVSTTTNQFALNFGFFYGF